jgi:nucleotide-binding universal stress UspA family protein
MASPSAHAPILVGYDGSAGSRDALALAKALATRSGSPLLLARIEPVGPLDLPYEVVLEPIQDRAEQALEKVARDLRAHGFEVGTRVGLLGSAAQGLHELAEEDGAELVVVGSSHRGRAGSVLAGTVGVRLLHGSRCPVAIAPRGLADAGRWSIATIGVAYDGSPESRAALEEARRLAVDPSATIKVIAVAETISSPHETIDPDAFRLASEARAQEWLHEARSKLCDEFTVVTQMVVGEPGRTLVVHSAGLDVLVLGSRGYGPLRRVLLGSVSSYVVEHCRCPLVVTPRGAQVSESPRDRAIGAAT